MFNPIKALPIHRLVALWIVYAASAPISAQNSTAPCDLTGPYLGQAPPGNRPEVFAPGIVSTKKGHEFCCSFSPDGKEIYFNRGMSIYVATLTPEGWTKPAVVTFTEGHRAHEAHVTRDNKQILFGCFRPNPIDGDVENAYGLWIAERCGDGWGAARYLGKGMYATSAASGSIYVTDIRPNIGEGIVKLQIINNKITGFIKQQGGMENPGPNRKPGRHPFIALDESYLIFDAYHRVTNSGALFVCFRTGENQWSKAIELSEINFAGHICPFVSPDGKYLFYAANGDIYWVGTEIIQQKWEEFLKQSKLAFVENGEPDSAILDAVRRGDLQKITSMIEKYPDLIRFKNQRNSTPLHWAATGGKDAVVELLLNRGAMIDAKDCEGHAPLHLAALRNRHSTVQLLLEKGAEVESLNSYGRTPLLIVARETGNVRMAQILLDHGADVNARDRLGDTPLTFSAWRGFAELVDLLLNRGAEFDPKGRSGSYLLQCAAKRKLDRLFCLLVESGVDLGIGNPRRSSLLHCAAEGGSKQIVRTFLDHGAPINEKDRYGWSPLHYAANRGRFDVVELLLDRGADANLTAPSGRSPYHLAVARDHVAVAELLATRGAKPGHPRFPLLQGEYFGQKKPGSMPVLFALDMVSSSDGEHGCVSFSPDGKEAYWSTSFQISDTGYTNGGILSSKVENGRWTEPGFAFFTRGLELDDDAPFCSPDGRRIYFISCRPLQGNGGLTKENIWYLERREDGWSDPQPVGATVNDLTMHWQISVSRKGTLYFWCREKGICASPLKEGRYGTPVPVANPSGDDFSGYSPFIAPDESYLLFSSLREGGFGKNDLFITFKDEKGCWTNPMNLGPSVNSSSYDNCPMVSIDGKYLFFISRRNGENDVYWVKSDIIERLKNRR